MYNIEGRKNGQCDEKKASEVRISEICRIGSNPKATMLSDESLLQLMIVYKDKPVVNDMVAIFNVLKLGLATAKSDRVKE